MFGQLIFVKFEWYLLPVGLTCRLTELLWSCLHKCLKVCCSLSPADAHFTAAYCQSLIFAPAFAAPGCRRRILYSLRGMVGIQLTINQWVVTWRFCLQASIFSLTWHDAALSLNVRHWHILLTVLFKENMSRSLWRDCYGILSCYTVELRLSAVI